jgi:hypothetical protein
MTGGSLDTTDVIITCLCFHLKTYTDINFYVTFGVTHFFPLIYIRRVEDSKGVIRIRKSKKNRQYNGQKKKYKRTNNDLQNIDIKLKIEYHEPH